MGQESPPLPGLLGGCHGLALAHSVTPCASGANREDTNMDTFTLTIKLGNDAMLTGYDVAKALKEMARKIKDSSFTRVDGGKLMDLNGNTVGRGEVK